MCTGPEARKLVHFHDNKVNSSRRQRIGMPTDHDTWTYAFIQSTSRIRELPKGTHFIICRLIPAIFNLILLLYNFFQIPN